MRGKYLTITCATVLPLFYMQMHLQQKTFENKVMKGEIAEKPVPKVSSVVCIRKRNNSFPHQPTLTLYLIKMLSDASEADSFLKT